jgi:hypothetical protein
LDPETDGGNMPANGRQDALLSGPVPVAWREGTLTRAAELESLCGWIKARQPPDTCQVLVGAVAAHLKAAREAAIGKGLEPKRSFRFFRNAPLLERARSNLDAAEAQLLNFAPPEYVLGQIPSLLRHIQCHLVRTDPRRQEVERIYAQQLFTRLVDRQGQTVLDSVRGADLPGVLPAAPAG